MSCTLKVKAAGAAMCPDFEALEDGVMRFVGRRFDATIGATVAEGKRFVPQPPIPGKPGPVVGVVKGRERPQGGWVPTGEVVELPFRKEYLDELRGGGLEPADAETARLAGIPFPAAGGAVAGEASAS